MKSTIRYRTEIDGLRSLAVLSVVVYHTNKIWIPGGYLGVDVFFVISGFLITSILLKQVNNKEFSFADFWNRRIKRIFPAAMFVLFVVSAVQFFVIFKPDLVQVSSQKIAAIFSFANIYFWKNTGDYWGNASESSPFIHYWSLAVEEQYYLLYPLFIIPIIKRGVKITRLFLACLVVFSLALFLYGMFKSPHATFYLLPTRMWQIGSGCLLASLIQYIPTSKNSIGTIIGFLLLLIIFFFPVNTSGIGFESIIAVIGACLIIWSGSNGFSKIVLENKIAVFIGKVSFSLYLWHWPIIVILRDVFMYKYISSMIVLSIIGVVVLFLFTLISYYQIENKIRKYKYGTILALSFSVLLSIYFLTIEPLLLKNPYESNFVKPTWHGKYYDLKPDESQSETFKLISSTINAPSREASDSAYRLGGIVRQHSAPEVKVVLIGDSHAAMWAHVVDSVTSELGLTTSLWTMTGVSGMMKVPAVKRMDPKLTPEERYQYDFQRQKYIKKWNPDIVIVANHWINISDELTSDLFVFLEENAKKVILVESPPELIGVGNRCLYQYLSFLNRDYFDSNNQYWTDIEIQGLIDTKKKLNGFVDKYDNFSLLPVVDLFLNNGDCQIVKGNKVLYLDDDHLTDEGALLAKQRFKSLIEKLL